MATSRQGVAKLSRNTVSIHSELRRIMFPRPQNFLALTGTVAVAALLLAACSGDAGEAAGNAGEESSANVVATTMQGGALDEQITARGGGGSQTIKRAGEDARRYEG